MERRPIVLSGGGARGIAHIGVLRALLEGGITAEAISGTSAGAMVGAFIAEGWTPQEVMDMLREEWKLHRTRWKLLRGELLTQRRIGEFMQAHLRARYFEELAIPFHVAATDLERGGQRIFRSGELLPALLASSAIPVIFPSVLIDGTPYVDGGLSNNLPVEPFADRKADVIAVYVNPLPPFNVKRSLRRTLDRTFHLSFREMVARSAAGCHLFIEPPELSAYGMFDLRLAAEIEACGYRYTKDLLAGK